ncbi:hypothetical protein BC940DRAFT_350860 [Gongronella butleri]|nr:hypothetical protein BC940DRAFT_350860 [Gongronella butleri]
MATTHERLLLVTEHQEQGRIKDAYLTLLEVLDASRQQLHTAKFVHQSMVHAPVDHDQVLQSLRTCIDELQGMLSTTKRPPNPPLPPRPSKRPVPPPIVTRTDTPPPLPHRQRTSTTLISTAIDDDEPDDDDDEEIDLLPSSATPISGASSSSSSTCKIDDPATRLVHGTGVMDTTRDATEQLMPVQPQPQQRGPLREAQTSKSVLLLQVDSLSLVPAQIDPSATLGAPLDYSQHVPKIPPPPLLAYHRQLQQQLDVLDQNDVVRPLSTPATGSTQALVQAPHLQAPPKYPRRPTTLTAGSSLSSSTVGAQPRQKQQQQQQQQQQAGVLRRQLTEVRTLYMSAMTVSTVLDLSPPLIAYQLTLIESAIFRAIPPDALRQHRANAQKAPDKHIVVSTDFFNYLTQIIEHAILMPQEAAHRAQVVVHWIAVATHCLALHNYQTLKAIVAALGTPPLQRLKRTWECIPKKRMARLDAMTTLMSETDNYHRYRDHLRTLLSVKPRPMVPFLGVIIHDATYALAAADHHDLILPVLDAMRQCLACPPYPHHPPASFYMKKKGVLRHLRVSFSVNHAATAPPTTSDAQENAAPSASPGGSASSASSWQQHELDHALVMEQQRITHYLLTRPWVSEKIMDELSLLREQSVAAANMCMTPSNGSDTTLGAPSSSSDPVAVPAASSFVRSRANSFQHAPPIARSPSWRSSGYSNHSRTHSLSISQMSNGSWLSASSSTSTADLPASPRSVGAPDDWPDAAHVSPRRAISSFWPFRKSGELARDDIVPGSPLRTASPTPLHHKKTSSIDNTSIKKL